jgi:hypothetical protein
MDEFKKTAHIACTAEVASEKLAVIISGIDPADFNTLQTARGQFIIIHVSTRDKDKGAALAAHNGDAGAALPEKTRDLNYHAAVLAWNFQVRQAERLGWTCPRSDAAQKAADTRALKKARKAATEAPNAAITGADAAVVGAAAPAATDAPTAPAKAIDNNNDVTAASKLSALFDARPAFATAVTLMMVHPEADEMLLEMIEAAIG